MKSRDFNKQFQLPFLRFWRSLTARRVLWGIAFFCISVLLLGPNLVSSQVNMQEGQPSPRDFKAPQGIFYESKVLTEIARQEAGEKVEPVFSVDPAVLQGLQLQVASFFRPLRDTRLDYNLSYEDKLRRLEELPIRLPKSTLETILTADSAMIDGVELDVNKIIKLWMVKGVSEENLEATHRSMVAEADNIIWGEDAKNLAKALLQSLILSSNLYFDMDATRVRQEEARAGIAPVLVTLRQGEKIVGEGELVSAKDIEALQQFGLLRSRSPYQSLFGVILFTLVIYILVLYYLLRMQQEIYLQENRYTLLGLLLIVTLLVGRAVNAINLGSEAELGALVGYMIPTAAGAMLIAVLLDSQLAVFATLVLGLLLGVVTGMHWQFMAVAVAGGLAGIYSVSKLSQRSDLVKASLYIIATNILTIVAVGMMQNNSLGTISVGVLLGVINGILSSVLTIGTLPFLETAFGITTSVRLLELSNPNQPLLKRLLLEAPGTYHHSVVVGNLAETAADAVGADSLITRVGAYYHDIGKLKRPYFFIENQLSHENPHDKLAPTLSTLILTAHIRDGMELAREHKLPQAIRDIIEQHHGRSLISFFFHKAAERNEVMESDFRYESPKPRSKEAAIIMLADAVEAGVRSLATANPGRMEAFVRKIIRDKLDDGQLEECDLTFKELDVIASAFVRTLNGIYHARVEYPDTVLKEMEKGRGQHETLRKQPAG